MLYEKVTSRALRRVKGLTAPIFVAGLLNHRRSTRWLLLVPALEHNVVNPTRHPDRSNSAHLLAFVAIKQGSRGPNVSRSALILPHMPERSHRQSDPRLLHLALA